MDDDIFEDNANNNVDENSNDHQFIEYANYHQLYSNHNYLANSILQQQRDAQEEEMRERILRRFNNSRDQPDRAHIPSQDSEFSRPLHGSLHRRNLSEDLSLDPDNLPLLPQRNRTSAEYSAIHNRRHWFSLRSPQPTDDETQTAAEELLVNFTAEQFHYQNLPSPIPSRPYTNPTWARAGKDLRLLADAFSKSNERELVRRKAYEVNMSSITMENFFHLCSELFQGDGGVTQERIVVLFTFISDVAIQHVRIRAEQFINRLLSWSLRFIFERICQWVQAAGGWAAVLSQGMSLLLKTTMVVAAVSVTVALSVYIIKTIKEL